MRGKRGGADGLVSSVPRVDETRCVACGRCEAICPYGAIQVLPRSDGWTCRIQARACRGCGQCTAVCPTEALTSPFDVRVPEAQVVVFHCNGGALAEEDLNWPSGGTKGVFLPCTGMVNAAQVLEAAAAGARIVLLAGCETCRFPAPHHGCPAEQTAEVAQALLRLAGSAAQVSYFAAGPGSRLVSAVRSVVDKEGS